jgi:hypothetical protein
MQTVERLTKQYEKTASWKARAKEERDQKKMKECTFAPKIVTKKVAITRPAPSNSLSEA